MSTTTWTVTTDKVTAVAGFNEYVELCKPRIALLVLVMVALSVVVAAWGQPSPLVILHAVVGVAFVAASGSAGNQWIERISDSRMPRTASRPLPSGRLTSRQALAFCGMTLVAGLVYLTSTCGWLAATLGLLTWMLYVMVYTPLKQMTAWNTAVGAVAGSMPILIGWAASDATWDLRVASLFLLLFLWQFPHFMAIAWLYRAEYAAAGMQMSTVTDSTGRRAGIQAVLGALAILPVSLVPILTAPRAPWCGIVLLTLGCIQLGLAWAFCVRRDDAAARRLLRATLVYLPLVFIMLALFPAF